MAIKTYFEKDEITGDYREVSVDDAAELKNALAKEREETKSFKQKAKELEELKAKLEEEKLLADKKYEELWNTEKTAKEMTAKQLNDLKEKIAIAEKNKIASEIVRNNLAKTDAVRAELLIEQALKFIHTTEEGIKILSPDGKDLDEKKLVSLLGEKFPILCDGYGSSGGGAKGSIGSLPIDSNKTTVDIFYPQKK